MSAMDWARTPDSETCAQTTALALDVRGPDAVKGDFDRRNEAASRFAADFPVLERHAAPILPRLKELLSAPKAR
jgi:hypothetical protein